MRQKLELLWWAVGTIGLLFAAFIVYFYGPESVIAGIRSLYETSPLYEAIRI